MNGGEWGTVYIFHQRAGKPTTAPEDSSRVRTTAVVRGDRQAGFSHSEGLASRNKASGESHWSCEAREPLGSI